MNRYSPEYAYIRAFEKQVREAQFPVYVLRFLEIYRRVRKIYSMRKFIELCKKAYQYDRKTSYLSRLEAVIPDGHKHEPGLSTPAQFIFNLLSIYGPAKLRKEVKA